MKKREKNTELYIVPEKAKDKLRAAQKIRQTVYLYGVTCYGKTKLIRHYLKNMEYYYLDAAKDPEEKFQISVGEHKIVVIDNLQFAEPQKVREAIAGLADRKDFWLILSARCPLPEWMVSSFVRNGPFMMIEEKDLAMTEKDIRKFFQEYGVYTDDESIRQITLPELCVTANAPSMINGGKDFCEWTRHDKEIADGMGKILPAVLGKYGPGLIELGLAESYFEKGADLYEVIRLASRGQIQAESHGKVEQEFVAAGIIARVHVMSGHIEDANFMIERFEEQARKAKGGS